VLNASNLTLQCFDVVSCMTGRAFGMQKAFSNNSQSDHVSNTGAAGSGACDDVRMQSKCHLFSPIFGIGHWTVV